MKKIIFVMTFVCALVAGKAFAEETNFGYSVPEGQETFVLKATHEDVQWTLSYNSCKEHDEPPCGVDESSYSADVSVSGNSIHLSSRISGFNDSVIEVKSSDTANVKVLQDITELTKKGNVIIHIKKFKTAQGNMVNVYRTWFQEFGDYGYVPVNPVFFY